MGWFKWFVALVFVAVIVAAGVWYFAPPAPMVTTKLELEANGGFAYIHSPGDNELNIAFLRDTLSAELDAAGNPVCDVKQVGVDLIVVSGVITSFSSTPPQPVPPDRIFNLKGAVVTFPDLANSAQPLNVNRGNRPDPAGPWGPANPNDHAQWSDPKWVPGIRYAAGPGRLADYPASTLDPNWRTKVDGRIVLTHGDMAALHPSDVAAKDSIFEFKTPIGSKTPYKQALTDATRFTANVPANQIVINLTGSAKGYTQIVLQPTAPGKPVRLKVKGRHTHDTPPDLPVGSALKEYCAFYELLQPVPAKNDQLIPHLFSAPAIVAGLGGQPSPGPYCSGEWYPE